MTRKLLGRGRCERPTKRQAAEQPPLHRVCRKLSQRQNVKNPLLGGNGATRVFGPQKGASKSNLDNLERALTRLADIMATEFGFDYRDQAGEGAAGGLGFGLLSFCGATIGRDSKLWQKQSGLKRR